MVYIYGNPKLYKELSLYTEDAHKMKPQAEMATLRCLKFHFLFVFINEKWGSQTDFGAKSTPSYFLPYKMKPTMSKSTDINSNKKGDFSS